MSSSAPLIETSRLLLRGHRLADFEMIAALWSDAEMVRFIGGVPSSREASWSRFLRYLGHWTALGFGYWVIFDKATDRFVGEIGLADYQRDMVPSMDGMAEMGWVLNPEFHGKGYAHEAALAVLRWASQQLDRQLCCIIAPNNIPSLHLATKLGFVAQCDTYYQGAEVRLFTRPVDGKQTAEQAGGEERLC